jgi:hypothetical protein
MANYCLIGNPANNGFLDGSGNNLIGIDPQLGALADNGGLRQASPHGDRTNEAIVRASHSEQVAAEQ